MTCFLQLSDFGLAMWASASAAPMICNDVAGTFGFEMLVIDSNPSVDMMMKKCLTNCSFAGI